MLPNCSMQRMKLWSCNILRLVFFIILLGLAIYVFMKLSVMRNHSDHHVSTLSERLRNKTFSQIEHTANMFLPLNYSASSLARGLSSALNGTQLPFTTVQTKVAPLLFLAFQTIPFVSQVSYVGQDELMFTFYTEEGHDEDQTFALFSNSSSSSIWYSQPVNRDTGMLYGQPEAADAKTVGITTLGWSKESLKGTMGYASQSSIGIGLNKAKRELFFNTATMDARGKISVGFPVQYVDDRFSALNFYGADFHLASNDGQVIVETKIPHTRIHVYNGTVSVQVKNLNGSIEYMSNNQSCKMRNGERGQFALKIREKELTFYCSAIEIAGLESVYTVAFTAEGMGSDVLKGSKHACLLVMLLLVIVVVSLCSFFFVVFKAARREMFLCAALVKQMESTHQAEKKSITKSLAFAAASHDIRNGFGNITCRIDSCLNEASPDPELAANLVLINNETMGLLGILNSVLDASKIEAGKMPLKVEEFDLTELLENTIDWHYQRAIEKGVDLILDPYDGSLSKFRLVKGDKVKIKQIVSNLVMNAIKFTSEGHISVRASVRSPSKENALIACNRHSQLNCFTKLWTKKKCCCNAFNELPAIQQNPNCMEFIFDVDDTGVGIPKDKQKYVFENFVQVKETAPGEEGYGLGLGIVQSLVHLMGGEIKIVDKEFGERGTHFQFNIFLTTSVQVSAEAEEHENNAQNHGLRSYIYRRFGRQFWSSPTRLEGSHVVLFLAGEERRKVLSKAIGNMNIKVSVMRNINELVQLLDGIKRKLDLSSGSPEKFEVTLTLTTDDTNEVASATKDAHVNRTIPQCKRSNSNGSSNVILIIIDSLAGPLLELSSSIVNFKKDLQNLTCKAVLLRDDVSSGSRAKNQQENIPHPSFDYVFPKPLHGKCLSQVLELLGEHRNSSIQHAWTKTTQEIECQELDSDALAKCQLKEIVIPDGNKRSTNKDFIGKKVLVVDDDPILLKVNSKNLCKLGADVDVCKDGIEAVDKVWKSLNDTSEGDSDANKTYDFILMDCQMQVMSGCEATKHIRKEEKKHGIHIPIIALTADDETRHITEAGMDYHLTKPLNIQKLYDIISHI